MPTESWLARACATVGRQTPAYQAADVGAWSQPDGSRLRRVAAIVARQTPAYRAAFRGRSPRTAATVRPRGAVGADVAVAARGAAKAVVAMVAPAELLSFQVVSDAFFARSRRRFAGAGHLSFGDRRAGAGGRLTPVVLTAATAAVEYLSRVGRQDRGQLSELDAGEIHRIVGEVARDASIADATAARIADELVEALRNPDAW